jgi:hypothetical protein
MKSEENMVIGEIEKKGMVKETGIKKTNNA